MSTPLSNSPALHPTPACFALLDDAQGDGQGSRLYTGLERVLRCDVAGSDASAWPGLWREVQLALDAGGYVVAVLTYELGASLQDVPAWDAVPEMALGSQLLVFAKCERLDREQVSAFLSASSEGEVAGVRGLKASVTQEAFTRAIETVRAYIAAGDTYQVNYTYRLHFQTYGSALALYLALRQRQPVPYGALICLPNGEAVLSLSPELFIRHTAGRLFARPMKGTAAATGDEVQDRMIAEALRQDEKNRAENLMIVDLLRNDLGRIARTGSVSVPRLFEVNRYSSVLQMTSDIEADLRSELSLAEIMSALFPCGSITGAPKRRTMEIIREIESEPRGIYTGAIGWFDPPIAPSHLGDFCLSVPIRTLVLGTEDAQGNRRGMMGVGAGIVYDSQPYEEFLECQLKAKFLTGLQPHFELFETMHAHQGSSCEAACNHWQRHLQRLKNSAEYFGFPYDEETITQQVRAFCAILPPQGAYRLRLALRAKGEIVISHAPLNDLIEPVKLAIAPLPCTMSPTFLAHKTSHRQQYDQAWQAAEKQGAFDQLFVNADGWVTEGGRSNIFIRQGEQWFTPPLSAGVLPGIMRAVLLDDVSMNAGEKPLRLEDVLRADEIILCNSLRGVMRVTLL